MNRTGHERIVSGGLRWLTTLAACLSSTFAAAESRPSFPCSKAQTQVEKLICAHASISELDRKLAMYYAGAQQHFERSGARDCLRQDQREWLRNVRNQCSQASCLETAYLQRLALLDGVQPGAAAITDRELPPGPVLIAIAPPSSDAPQASAAAHPFETRGTYAINLEYTALTLTDNAGRVYVLRELLNESPPHVLERFENKDAQLLIRGRLLDAAPDPNDYPDQAPPTGRFDPAACLFFYEKRLAVGG